MDVRDLSLPLIPGLSPSYVSHKKVISTPGNFFQHLDPHNKPSYMKYLLNQNLFKNQNGPILKFYASLDDRGELPKDIMRFRKCHIFYHVEDGTIKIFEPRQRNTGFQQGYVLCRHRIPKQDGGFYTLDDLNVGNTLKFYGRRFKLIDCDPFTRNFLKEMGYRVGSPEPELIDPVYADRQEMDKHRTNKQKPHVRDDKDIKFYKNFPRVLHFRCIYERMPPHIEDKCYASLYYSLANDTIKIVDEQKLLEYKKHLINGNYDSYLILKPTCVPKKPLTLDVFGESSRTTVLNLSANTRTMTLHNLMSRTHCPVSFLVDANTPEQPKKREDYYTPEDFDLGITLNIFGAKVYLYDCDEFTKEFYIHHFNKELLPVPLPEVKDSKYPKTIYPNHFGDPDDSLLSCKRLESVRRPAKYLDAFAVSAQISHKGTQSGDLLKFLLNSREGCDGKELKFLARKISTHSSDKDQIFIITWFLQDDTIEIKGLDLNFTLDYSNEAIFLNRTKLVKPTPALLNAGTCYYGAGEMFVGNVIYARKTAFHLFDADEYTYEYMEHHSDVFPNSDINAVMDEFKYLFVHKATDLKLAFASIDKEHLGFVNYEDFSRILYETIPEDLRSQMPKQKLMTLARCYASEDYVGLQLNDLISRVQQELRKERFQDFEKLKIQFQLFDKGCEDNIYFDPATVYNIMRSYPLPIDRDLLKCFLFKFPRENGLIDCRRIIDFLDYIKNPADLPDLNPYAIDINWKRVEYIKNLKKVCYNDFLRQIMCERCPNCENKKT